MKSILTIIWKNLVMFGGKYWIVGKPAMAASLQISWKQEIIPGDFSCAKKINKSKYIVKNYFFMFSQPGCSSLLHSQ